MNVTHCPFSTPSVQQLLRILRENPDLEWLALDDVQFNEDDEGDAASSSTESVNLDALTTVAIRDLAPPPTTILLSKILAPNCENFELVVPGWRFGSHALLSEETMRAIHRFVKTSVQKSDPEDTFHLQIRRNSCAFTWSGGEIHVVCSADSELRLPQALPWLTRTLGEILSLRNLTVTIERGAPLDERGETYLSLLPSITILEVEEPKWVRPVVFALQTEVASKSASGLETKEWICPRLRALEIIKAGRKVELEELESFAQRRCATSSPDLDVSLAGKPQPKPLESLTIVYDDYRDEMTEDQLQKLDQALGEGVLTTMWGIGHWECPSSTYAIATRTQPYQRRLLSR